MYEIFYRILVTNLTFLIGMWIAFTTTTIYNGYKQKWPISKTLKNILLYIISAYIVALIGSLVTHSY
jgi:hypothetical protein